MNPTHPETAFRLRNLIIVVGIVTVAAIAWFGTSRILADDDSDHVIFSVCSSHNHLRLVDGENECRNSEEFKQLKASDLGAWVMSGNSGTDAGEQFLGTTDEQPLIFKTNGEEALRIDEEGRVILGDGSDPHFRFYVKNGLEDPRHVMKVTSDQEHTFLALENTLVDGDGALWYLTADSNGNFALHQPSIGDRLIVTEDGRVGIGGEPRYEGNPNSGGLQLLDVTSDSKEVGVAIGPKSDNNGWLSLYGGTPGTYWHISKRTSAQDDRLAFYYYDGSSYHEAMAVSPSGNVGIGVSEPHSRLQIHGPAGSNGLWVSAGDEPGDVLFHVEDSDGSVQALHVDAAGNVGVGTTTPQSTLQVAGYAQLDLTDGSPPAADCDEAAEYGRMKVDANAGSSLLYICTADGWVAK